MRRTNDKSLKEVIQQMLHAYNLKPKLDETALVLAWPDIMGKAVANRTKAIFIREKKLFVRIESAVIKNELLMIRSVIIDKMNEHVGAKIVEDIVFL